MRLCSYQGGSYNAIGLDTPESDDVLIRQAAGPGILVIFAFQLYPQCSVSRYVLFCRIVFIFTTFSPFAAAAACCRG